MMVNRFGVLTEDRCRVSGFKVLGSRLVRPPEADKPLADSGFGFQVSGVGASSFGLPTSLFELRRDKSTPQAGVRCRMSDAGRQIVSKPANAPTLRRAALAQDKRASGQTGKRANRPYHRRIKKGRSNRLSLFLVYCYTPCTTLLSAGPRPV